MPTIHSGGADGADMVFEKEGISAGMQVRAYSFQGHSTTSENRMILNTDQLMECLPRVRAAGIFLRKNVPRNSAYVLSLLCRNWYQVLNSNAVYAVSGLDRMGKVKGGTGWAVAMAIMEEKPVYLFDQHVGIWYDQLVGTWYKYNYNKKSLSDLWIALEKLPPPFPENFAGIGTRKLNSAGYAAIKNLFKQYKESLNV